MPLADVLAYEDHLDRVDRARAARRALLRAKLDDQIRIEARVREFRAGPPAVAGQPTCTWCTAFEAGRISEVHHFCARLNGRMTVRGSGRQRLRSAPGNVATQVVATGIVASAGTHTRATVRTAQDVLDACSAHPELCQCPRLCE
jgi:hypothetical protein